MGQRYVHQFYTARSGELGDIFLTQKQVKAYHGGLYLAENVDIDIAGNVAKRNPFKVFAEAPEGGEEVSYRVIELSFKKEAAPREKEHRFFVFGDRVVNVYSFDPTEGQSELLFSKATTYNADFIEQCDCCAVYVTKNEQTLLGNSFVFAHETHKPFAMYWRNNVTQPNDIGFIDLELTNLPMEEFVVDDRKGTDLGTGDCTITATEGIWKIVATNGAFTIGVKNNWNGVVITTTYGHKFRCIRRIDDKTLHCDLVSSLDFDKINQLAQEDVTFSLGYEPIVSELYGWFGCCGFYGGRLFFGRTRNLPLVVVGSTATNCFDFRPSSFNYLDGGVFKYLEGDIDIETGILQFAAVRPVFVQSGEETQRLAGQQVVGEALEEIERQGQTVVEQT